MKELDIFKNLLCPPGDGVFTVETGKEKKSFVQNSLYGSNDIQSSWEKSLEQIQDGTKHLLLGVPSDNGGGIVRGANWGPLFIRESLIKSKISSYFDIGDIRVVPHLLHDSYLNQETISKIRKALFREDLKLPVSALSICEMVIETLLNSNKKILSLGGDHSVSAGLLPPFIKKNPDLGILHFDAHTDLLEERLGIDKCFATWAANILPHLKSPQHLAQVGIRRSGKEKAYWEEKYKISQYWAEETRINGPEKIADQIISQFNSQGVTKIYISFDIDAIDSEYASATGTPEEGGLRPHEASLIIDRVASQFETIGADLVEVAPFINHYGSKTKSSPEPETTLDVASLIASKLLEAFD
ncbi:MAG: arginase [Halobacteriovorax sp.]|nr:arginase [Halobacteriovorax sp.]|tara:strand:- start:35699 stop:36769 length:1071 start_codon:yes stop_codon:yes gene_type:complete